MSFITELNRARELAGMSPLFEEDAAQSLTEAKEKPVPAGLDKKPLNTEITVGVSPRKYVMYDMTSKKFIKRGSGLFRLVDEPQYDNVMNESYLNEAAAGVIFHLQNLCMQIPDHPMAKGSQTSEEYRGWKPVILEVNPVTTLKVNASYSVIDIPWRKVPTSHYEASR